mgnify:CR=1 FL=1
MSKIKDCVQMLCDRCGYENYYTSLKYAENIGWELDVKLPDEEPADLCPVCAPKLSRLIRDFLYGKCDEGKEGEDG